MKTTIKKRLFGKEEIEGLLSSMVSKIAERVDSENLAILGIHTHGAILAKRMKNFFEKKLGYDIPYGELDITLYRDDLSEKSSLPLIKGTDIPFDINGKTIILVDDVLFTGRTIRSALNELSDFGRPAAIKLVVLVDRGQRELPIQPDFVGKAIDIPKNSMVRVKLNEIDNTEEVVITNEKV